MKALLCAAIALSSILAAHAQQDPLPSWRDGEAKASIVRFVEGVIEERGAEYRPPAERIAVFDNDGTLWAEQPLYFQLAFAIDRVEALAPNHPEWRTEPPFAALLDGDVAAVLEGGEPAVAAIIAATHAGVTSEEFTDIVGEWIETARHPKSGRRYTEMVYQPMLELLEYLRANDFKTYIVSGGGVDFIRTWSERVYGIPPEQVVGSAIELKFEMRATGPVLVRLPEIAFIDDKAGKPAGIQQHIGRRPIAAFGNSDGDLEMLQWTTAGDGSRLGVIVHHTDGEREYAYDRESAVGRLNVALDAAAEEGWTVVDMRRDWAMIFPAAVKTP